MEGREISLQEVMAFREEKAFHQAWMQQKKPGCVIISLGMNIPGPRKTAPPVRMAFFAGVQALEELLRQEKFSVCMAERLEKDSGFAALYAVSGSSGLEVKKKVLTIEESHPLGRLFDIDVMDGEGRGISRQETGFPPRKCLICDKDAKVCGRSRAHTVQELEEAVLAVIQKYDGTSACRNRAQTAET
ncbi:MAG: citrate lyase holo-[acyl-carrier protein] synthase [Lachnospiraceae bacterium]|nr:citrate lyase holo-[acyl-carrier protein] synthase [Lachnospiraceae bacterium]